MNRKGFTLIELLAIIVILAIIAVITIPKITKITEKSRKDSASLSANGYIEAVEKYAMIESQNDDEFEMEGEFTILDGVLSQDSETYTINVNGTIPTNGNLVISEGDVVSGCLTMGKYRVIISDEKVSETSKGNCTESYTITFDSNGGSEVASITVLSGQPITRPTNPTKADTKFLGWYTESDLTNKFNFNNGVSEDITLYAKWGTPVMDDDSWDEIKANLTSDRDYYTIGDTKIIHFDRDGDEVDEYYKIRLVNTEACGNYTGSRTSCGVVFEFVTFIGTSYMNANNTNAGGWHESYMRKYLNPRTETYTNNYSIFSKLPSDLQSVIIDTAPIVSGSGNGGVSNDVVVMGDFLGDKLYLLSPKEVGYIVEYDNKKANTDTKTLKYYVNNTGGLYRIKYSSTTSEGVDSSADWYWLRTARSYINTGFCYIGYAGGDDGHEDDSGGGVAPAFRILD